MPHKRILFRSEARERVLRGATILADAVRVTLGPKSKCVLVEKPWGPPLVCNDGVTIVKEIDLEDPEENLGAHMLREAAERTADVVGDGTTTSTLLAHAIFADGLRNLAAGASAVDIKRGLDRGLKAAVATIRGLSKPVASRKEKAQVATISAHNDAMLGDFVAEAMDRVGSEGVVTVEEAKGMETSIEVVDGMQFDRGLLSPYFINDAERQQAVVENPLILLSEAKIASLKEFLPFLEGVVPLRRPLVVIAESVEAEALATLVVNRLRGILDCVAVKAPGYGDRRKELMQDMAILTGGRFISADLGVTLESVKAADLGSAGRVIVDRDTTTIIAGRGDKAAIHARCEEIRRQIREAKSDYDREKLEERLAKLAGGVAIIAWARPPKPSSRAARRRSPTRSAPRGPPWRRGSCPEAASRCCGRSTRSIARNSSARGTSGRACGSSSTRSRCRRGRSRKTRRPTGAWSWATSGGARAIMGSMPRGASTATSSRRGSSIRRRWCGRRSKTPSAWRARSCSPRRRSRR